MYGFSCGSLIRKPKKPRPSAIDTFRNGVGPTCPTQAGGALSCVRTVASLRGFQSSSRKHALGFGQCVLVFVYRILEGSRGSQRIPIIHIQLRVSDYVWMAPKSDGFVEGIRCQDADDLTFNSVSGVVQKEPLFGCTNVRGLNVTDMTVTKLKTEV